MKVHSKPKVEREFIYLHEKETPLFIKKIYHEHNKPDVCAYCKKKSEYLCVQIYRRSHIKTFKVCRAHLRLLMRK